MTDVREMEVSVQTKGPVVEPTLGVRLGDFARSLTRQDWLSLAGMSGFIVLLHVVGFGILFGLVAPQHSTLGGDHPVFTVGVGVLAYTFGLRHAFDADHIAAVDNTTRKLLADNADREPAAPQAALGRASGSPSATPRSSSRCRFLLSRRRQGARRARSQNDNSTLHSVTGVIGAVGLRRLPVDPRHPQPRRPDGHPPGLPRDAQRGRTTRPSSRSSSTSAAS